MKTGLFYFSILVVALAAAAWCLSCINDLDSPTQVAPRTMDSVRAVKDTCQPMPQCVDPHPPKPAAVITFPLGGKP